MSKLHDKKLSCYTIGVDILGSERGPNSVLSGLLSLLSQNTLPISIVFFCDELTASLQSELSRDPRISFIPCLQTVEMTDQPLQALRRKRNASLFVSLAALAEGKVDALISCGNTGALIAGAHHFIPQLASVKRSALIALLPTKFSSVAVVDIGANVSCTGEMLMQFALMGRAFQKARGIQNPTVGILNIGTEQSKGRKEYKEAYSLLDEKKTELQFLGNIEGRDVFQGIVDVLVTDGFTGNVFLKTAEGISSFILNELETPPVPSVQKLQKITDYTQHPGALLCGQSKMVFKCHGASNGLAVYNTISEAYKLLEGEFLKKMQRALEMSEGTGFLGCNAPFS